MQNFRFGFIFKLLILGAIIGAGLFVIVSLPPKEFEGNTKINIPKNSTLSEVAQILDQKKAIHSTFLFKVGVVLFRGEKSIVAGDYLFEKPQDVWTVAYRLSRGDQGLTHVKVTIPEGTDTYEIANILQKNIPGFSAPYFIKVAQAHEGYLFPDTYYFDPDITSEDVIKSMRANFNKKIETLSSEIKASKRTLKDIINMSSIVEKEGNSIESRKIIAGVLWKRLDVGMALQVDAPLIYIQKNVLGGKRFDNTGVESPYNTYLNKGLPKGPITNPGLQAIKDTLLPTKTEYWYYLSDTKGVTHYAVDYDGHLTNKEKYLK